ncbi:MAG: hypothetical protein FJ270_09340 [Planctomycetes bacterium]|nr:hypothetical protein [Planctomycetota bacterium]
MKRLGPVAAALIAGTVVGVLLARLSTDQSSFASSPDALLSLEPSLQSGPSLPQGRVLSPEQMDRIIAVARDLSVDLATRLDEARARDAETFRTALGTQAKRLGSLAVLRERRPELYAIRIEELRLEAQVLALGEQVHSAIAAGRTDDAERLEARLRPLLLSFVDSNLRSRAVELASLDSMMRELRVDLERDARQRTDTVERWVEALRDGREPAALGGRRPSDAAQAAR